MSPQNFWKELKRRNVYRVAIAYAIVSWLVAQIASLAASSFEAPDWVMKMLIIVLIIGFPVALVFAWAFELSPEGIVRTTSAAAGENPYPSGKKKPLTSNVFIGILLIIIAGQFLYNRYGSREETKESANQKSIAVLPFKLIGNDEEGQYFADGVMDVLISHLNRIEDLQVRSRTSVERFASPTESMKEISEKLNVGYVIEGSTQKYRDDIRIIIQLIDPISDDHLWEQTYDRKHEDIFHVQSEIALSIVDALQLIISPQVKAEIEAVPTQNEEAWDLYTRGRFYHGQYWKSRNAADIDIAIEFYDKSFQQDSSFGEPLIAKAQAIMNKHWFELDQITGLRDSIFEIANQAYAIAPQNDEVLNILGGLEFNVNRDDAKAQKLLQQSIALGPKKQNNYITAIHFFHQSVDWNLTKDRTFLDSAMIYAGLALEQEQGEYFSYLLHKIGYLYHSYGQFDIAIEFHDAALEMEPDNLDFLGIKMYSQLFSGEYEEALTTAQRINQLNRNAAGLADIGKIYLMEGNFEEAEDTYRRYYALPESIHAGGNHERHAYAYVLRKNNKEVEAFEQIELARQWIVNMMGSQPYDMAKVHSFLGEKEKAFEYLQEFKPWYGLHMWIGQDPLFEPIRNEPRFRDLLERCQFWQDSLTQVVNRGIAEKRFPRLEQLEY